MSARRVQAVIAAGVACPSLLDAWSSSPETLRTHGVEPGTVDLAAIKKFAGFTAKVRHNGVRTLLPMSFRLMSEAGFEIDLFASYASTASVHHEGYAGSAEERASRFIDFAQGWLDMRSREHVMFWDLLRHEHALSRLDRSGTDPAAPAEVNRPRLSGDVLLFEMQSDPAFVAAALAQRSGRWRDAEASTRYYAYQRPAESARIRIAELDAFGYYALTFIDGGRSVPELSVLLGAGEPPAARFLRALDQLAEGGLIRLPEHAR
jgi:hypothetical protein